MAQSIRVQAHDGSSLEFVPSLIGSGAMKDVFFSPDRSYVLAFFRDPQSAAARERLEMIVGRYRQSIFQQQGGQYWERLFRWPTHLVEHNGRLGVAVPTYQNEFFFQYGSINDDFLKIKGTEKQGKWFASASNQTRFLDPRERGNWLNYLRIAILISRAVRRLHAAGLAHSDLSYKNVLVDPVGGNACIIDIDGLVVPGKYPPDVVGTPDFIAPEVLMSSHLPKDHPDRKLPSIATDRHALAVLIYMYLLLRHPLRGDKVHDLDPQRDELLSMGERALFIEHPQDASNRLRVEGLKASEKPWKDTQALPYTMTGPYLSALFERAFIHALHDPQQRPTADEWEQALVRTVDLIQPCANPKCAQAWYPFDNTTAPRCPFCGTPYQGRLPVLNFYSARQEGRYLPDNHRLMVYSNQSLFRWHVNRNVFPNERLQDADRRRVGYFVLHEGHWWLVNEGLPDLHDAGEKRAIPIGSMVELSDGRQLLLSREDGGRLAVVQLVDAL